MGSNVVGEFRCDLSEYVAYCYWADTAVLFPKGSEIGLRSRKRAKPLICLLRKVKSGEGSDDCQFLLIGWR